MTAPLQYLLIIVKVVGLETVSFSDTQKILRLFVNKMTADENHCLLTRVNLPQTIQIQLSQKRKTFLKFFFAFLNSILNFKHMTKKDDPHS